MATRVSEADVAIDLLHCMHKQEINTIMHDYILHAVTIFLL